MKANRIQLDRLKHFKCRYATMKNGAKIKVSYAGCRLHRPITRFTNSYIESFMDSATETFVKGLFDSDIRTFNSIANYEKM